MRAFLNMVPAVGVEPTRLAAMVSKTIMSTSSIIEAKLVQSNGIEPFMLSRWIYSPLPHLVAYSA